MNGAMIGVTLAVVFGLPVAIWAVFACSKDQHGYARHYTSDGYSSELRVENREKEPPVLTDESHSWQDKPWSPSEIPGSEISGGEFQGSGADTF